MLIPFKVCNQQFSHMKVAQKHSSKLQAKFQQLVRINHEKYDFIYIDFQDQNDYKYYIEDMKASEYRTPQIQYDNENYVKSFNVDTATDKQLHDFYHKYGIIVFRDVLSQQQIQATIDDLWNNTTEYYKIMGKQVKRDDPKTWGQIRGFQKAYGFVGDDILEEPQIWDNRRNPIIYKCFKRAYDAYLGKPLTQPLIACFDRGSLMLPSKINKNWRSQDIYHFDIDPWAWTGQTANQHPKYDYDPNMKCMLLGENNYDPFIGYTKLAGVLALSDTNETSGGFQCACGFQNFIHLWCKQNQLYTHIEEDKNLVENFRRIYVRKGSLLIFSRQLPHNIYQNDSDKFRYAQYLRMIPYRALCLTPELQKARKKLVRMLLPKNIDFSDPISKQVFMLDNADLDEEQRTKQVKVNKKQKIEQKSTKVIPDQYTKKKKQDKVSNNTENKQKNCQIN